jgi:hypothetical protein
VVKFKFRINASERVATAGSCFAQHIARHLTKSGFNYYVTEQAHPLTPAAFREKYNYGVFSARYGNIYTSRQLVQLFDRAYGQFTPRENVWNGPDGRFFDPFRPNIQPAGFASEAELRADRNQHFAAVRRMFETLDVFVFTLGLTEGWTSVEDGAAFPLCPGVVAGTFDATRHRFVNLTTEEVVADVEAFLQRLWQVNASARIVLTVSPVPLMATAEDRHILVSTTLSKSVLRVAADVVDRKYPNVAYFPSYEIITGAYSRGSYFGPDLRAVTEDGVQHVMRLFLRHATDAANLEAGELASHATPTDAYLEEGKAIVDVICDEDALQYVR